MTDEPNPLDNPFTTTNTTTTIFLIPPFQIDATQLRTHGFWNAYIADQDREHDQDGLIYCLFKPGSDFHFEQFLEKLDEQGIVLEDYDYEGGFVVVVLIFPEQYMADYRLIVEGKYSRCSPAFQALFPKEKATQSGSTIVLTASITRRVFEKMETLKECIQELFGVDVDAMGPDFEYWPAFDGEEETLNITRLTQKLRNLQA